MFTVIKGKLVFSVKHMIWNSSKNAFIFHKSFSSMMECHNYLKKYLYTFNDEWIGTVDKNYLIATKIANNHLPLIKYMESKFKCSGVCKPALFFYTLDLSHGRPLTTCGYQLTK